MKKITARQTNDFFVNAQTGLNQLGKDKTRANKVKIRLVDRLDAAALYQSSEIFHKIINRPVYDMLRQGWHTFLDFGSGFEDHTEKIDEYFQRFNLKNKIKKALKWARLFGGAGIILGLEDGQESSSSVKNDAIKSINFMTTIDRYGFNSASISDIQTDPTKNNFKKHEFYSLVNDNSDIQFKKIHESRVLRFQGDEVTSDLLTQFDYWGNSVTNLVYNVVEKYETGHDASSNLIQDYSFFVMTLSDLQNLIVSEDEDDPNSGYKRALIRLNLLKQSLSNQNMAVIGPDEKIERMNANISGIKELLDKGDYRLVAASGIPHTLLLGEGPSGLQSDGSSELIDYYDSIRGMQLSMLEPELRKIYSYSFASKDGPTKGLVPTRFKIEFNPLWQLDEVEVIKNNSVQAETYLKLIEAGIISSQEALNEMIEKGVLNKNSIDLKSREELSLD